MSVADYLFLGRELPSRNSWFSLLGLLVSAAGYVAIGLGGANMGTFFWHTLQQCMIEPGGVALGFMHEAGSPSKTEKKKKQTYSLLVIALLQPLWFWWLLARV